jgi:hypothetical protein
MELEVQQNSMMVVRGRGHHDEKARRESTRATTQQEDLVMSPTSPPEDTNSTANHSWFWQDKVPVMLGLGAYNEARCQEGKTKEETTKNDNWLSRLYWCVPVMFPPFILILTCPFLYLYSTAEVRKDLNNLVLSYAGFFIANWIILYLLNPESFPRRELGRHLKKTDPKGHIVGINGEPTMMLLMVATCGVIFRVVATAHGEHEDASVSARTENASATIKPADIYMNLNRSISDVMVRFIGQSFLMWYYCAALVERTDAMLFRFCSVPRVQFVCIVLLALPCLQGVLRAALGKDFLTNSGSWNMILESRAYKTVGKDKVTETSLIENYIRAAMGFLVNQVYPGIILFTIHAMIFHLSYLDLTKTLFSVAFITKLDDEPDDVAHIEIIVYDTDKEGESS